MSEKSYVSADNAYFAIVSQDDADAYVADTPEYLAPSIKINHTPKVNSATQYADGQAFDADSAEGETEIEIEITGMPLSRLATLLGKTYDAATGRMFDGTSQAPDIAVGFRAERRPVGGVAQYRYYWYLKAVPQVPAEEHETKTDTPNFKSTTLKFTAIHTKYQFDHGVADYATKRVVGDTEDNNFSASTWFDDVQVPVAGSAPSLTATPSPADGATGVAVSVSPTVTFSNALRTGVMGAILSKDDGTLVASAYSIDAAKKVITINPDSNLSGTSDYLITVSVRDIYGQVLRAVYNFTTV